MAVMKSKNQEDIMKQAMYKCFVFIIGIGLLAGGCSRKSSIDKEIVSAIPVEIATVKTGNLRKIFSFTGNIEPWRQVNIVPDVGGKVAKIYVEVGDLVTKGQILAELDAETFKLRLEQAKAGLAVAQANFEDAKRNWERIKELKEKDSVSKQQYEKVQLGYNAAKAQLQQAQVAFDLAEWQLRVSVMKAPFAGAITGKYMNEGEIINPQMPGGRGVVGLMDFSRVKITVRATEIQVHQISPGQRAEISVDAYPNRVFIGEVYAVSSAADPGSRTFEVQIKVPNPDFALKAGMFCRVEIVINERNNVLTIPVDAILNEEGKHCAFVIESDRAIKRSVELGLQEGTVVELLSGLHEGEKVVTVGKEMIEDSSTVDVKGGEVQ